GAGYPQHFRLIRLCILRNIKIGACRIDVDRFPDCALDLQDDVGAREIITTNGHALGDHARERSRVDLDWYRAGFARLHHTVPLASGGATAGRFDVLDLEHSTT